MVSTMSRLQDRGHAPCADKGIEVVALQDSMLNEAVDVFMSAFEREALTSAFLDLSQGKVRTMYARLIRTKFAVYRAVGHPVFAAVQGGRVAGVVLLTSPHVSIPARTRFLATLGSLPYFMGLVPHAIRGLRAVGVLKHPHALPGSHYTLEFIAVDPALQGNGVGRMLLEKTEEYCLTDRSTTGVHLYTGDDRNRAIYERFGYELVEERRAGGVTGYHMFRANVS